MTDHNLYYYPYASLANAQLPLLKVAALYFDKLTAVKSTSKGSLKRGQVLQ